MGTETATNAINTEIYTLENNTVRQVIRGIEIEIYNILLCYHDVYNVIIKISC
jgi:hypothetical protein